MERAHKVGLLFGLMFGLIAGVELVHLSDEMVCPQNICLGMAQVIPLSDRGYFPEVHRILQNSRESIHMAVFELKYYDSYPNSSANILVEDILAARGRGVEVKIVVDDFSTENNALPLLKENGVDVKSDSENVTTHAKLIVVDGEVVVLGSTNLSFYGLEKNNEVDVVLVGRDAAEYYERYFLSLWDSI